MNLPPRQHSPPRLLAACVLALLALAAPLSAHAGPNRQAAPQAAEAQVDAAAEAAQRHGLNERPWSERNRFAGETLVYSVEILGGEAARAAISMGPIIQHEQHGRVIPLEGVSSSTGFFERMYPMRNVGETYLDPETGQPVFAEKIIRERGRERSYAVTYARNVYRADVRRVRDGRADGFRRYVPSDIHDGFSWIYDMRSRDLSVGHEFVYYVYDGWRLSRLTFQILSHERISTPIGVRDAAYFRVTRDVLESWPLLPWAERTAVLPPVFQPTMSYTLGHGWISLDEQRVPIGVELDSPLGPIRMMVSRHTFDP